MVNFTNLDLGYEQSSELYSVIGSRGEDLLSNLSSLYNGLNNHWKGEDATLHINQIVDVYNGLNTFVKETGNAIADATKRIVEVQQVRKANGSSGEVGSELPNMGEKGTLSKIDGTIEYSCVPEAKGDLQELIQICSIFDEFVEEVRERSDELLHNWLDGNEREKVVNNLKKFEDDAVAYKGFLRESRSALEIATSNLSQIM